MLPAPSLPPNEARRLDFRHFVPVECLRGGEWKKQATKDKVRRSASLVGWLNSNLSHIYVNFKGKEANLLHCLAPPDTKKKEDRTSIVLVFRAEKTSKQKVPSMLCAQAQIPRYAAQDLTPFDHVCTRVGKGRY